MHIPLSRVIVMQNSQLQYLIINNVEYLFIFKLFYFEILCLTSYELKLQ